MRSRSPPTRAGTAGMPPPEWPAQRAPRELEALTPPTTTGVPGSPGRSVARQAAPVVAPPVAAQRQETTARRRPAPLAERAVQRSPEAERAALEARSAPAWTS